MPLCGFAHHDGDHLAVVENDADVFVTGAFDGEFFQFLVVQSQIARLKDVAEIVGRRLLRPRIHANDFLVQLHFFVEFLDYPCLLGVADLEVEQRFRRGQGGRRASEEEQFLPQRQHAH